ncbi:MAG: hypothetical protein H6Q70_3320 [Firmicutes bacterium]|nr:hypothetical protein [Bacillota bacterium]
MREVHIQETVASITYAYISLLNNISYFRCVKGTRIWAFSRDEIYKLFQLAAKLIKINGDLPVMRPLKGVLMTSISNYILKLRNDYNEIDTSDSKFFRYSLNQISFLDKIR